MGLASGLSLAVVVLAGSPTAPCTLEDDRGQPFRVCFDPGTGLELGVAVDGRQAPGAALTPGVSAAILYRTERESRSKEGSLWFNEHRLLATRVQPGGDQRWLRGTVYQGLFRRHLTEGFVLVPTAKPLRLPFPFDLAITASVGTYERRVFDGPGFVFESGKAAVLLDPLRSQTGKAHLLFGPALSHTLRSDGREVTQEISPMTSGLVDFGFETEDGWWNLRLVGVAGMVFTPGQAGVFRARGEAVAERVLFAVNDAPLWESARFTYALHDAGVARKDEWAASLGLTVRLFGR